MNTLMKSETPVVPAKVERDHAWILPAVNVYETPEGYLLEADMPGVSKKGIEITFDNNELTLVGHREVAPVKADVVYRESKPAAFRRTFEVDPTIDSSRITAQMEQGLLTLHLPKAELVKPRKIAVT